tara:strand:- start:7871 stop:8746 length:876 start_codon:yes stop_codon:yes gene_type:complete
VYNKNFINLNKFSIGTAQIGMKYGVNNKTGKIKYKEAKKIISLARKKGIKSIDTAYQYSDGEKILGKIGVKDFKITSKIPYIKKEEIYKIKFYLKKSLKNLKVNHLECVLIHHPLNLKKNTKKIYEELINLKKNGLVKKIGVSITDFNDIYKILDKYNFDTIQVPHNILDHRLMNKRLIKLIRKKNITIEVRSIFLQGLLFKNIDFINNKFKKIFFDWKLLNFFFKKTENKKLEYMVNFVYQNKLIKKIIIGVDNQNQLIDISKIIRKKIIIKKKISCQNSKIINPNLWKE